MFFGKNKIYLEFNIVFISLKFEFLIYSFLFFLKLLKNLQKS